MNLPHNWNSRYPIHWINLDRQTTRFMRMKWALTAGDWNNFRWSAVDGTNLFQEFMTYPRPWQSGGRLPGLQRSSEAEACRNTSRQELACLSSWQSLIDHLPKPSEGDSNWYLLMEDDVGSSLACPEAWPFNLDQLTEFVGNQALAIQLAPISRNVRIELHQQWLNSQQKLLAVPKQQIRSHGNGAVLLHRNALPYLQRRLGRWINKLNPKLQLLGHPRNVRPVADKWLYASLPEESCWVCTYPLFCLEAQDSSLHTDHVHQFHAPSRDTTLQIWKSDGANELLKCFEEWSNL